MFRQDYPAGSTRQKGKQSSPFNNHGLVAGSSIRTMSEGWTGGHRLSANLRRTVFANPIMGQAEDLMQRTMILQSPEDLEVANLIQDDSEGHLPRFLSRTLTNAIMMYRQGGHSTLSAPIGSPGNKPGPIGPPWGKGAAGKSSLSYTLRAPCQVEKGDFTDCQNLCCNTRPVTARSHRTRGSTRTCDTHQSCIL